MVVCYDISVGCDDNTRAETCLLRLLLALWLLLTLTAIIRTEEEFKRVEEPTHAALLARSGKTLDAHHCIHGAFGGFCKIGVDCVHCGGGTHKTLVVIGVCNKFVLLGIIVHNS